jgi:hypothetical protein
MHMLCPLVDSLSLISQIQLHQKLLEMLQMLLV